ncbi:hypothetical protein X737_15210 [Mesorhizobium sp. L48C026A00]|nr:hypothetical protein X737_15210 [Mesorhizobium sp. L48C026A00]
MNVFGRQVVTGAVCAAVETWVRQIAMFGVFVVLARHRQVLGPRHSGSQRWSLGAYSVCPSTA